MHISNDPGALITLLATMTSFLLPESSAEHGQSSLKIS